MPTAFGPFSFSTRFHWRAMTSKAWSQLTGWSSAVLSNSPLRMRMSGVVSRSAPYMILERK